MLMTSACSKLDSEGRQPAGIDGGSPGELSCVIRTEAYNVHLSAYQERGGSSDQLFENLCQDLPDTGRTYLAVDLVSADKKVRDLPVTLRLVEESPSGQGGSEAVPAILRTLRENPAKVYKTGIAEMQVDFDKPGYYALLIGAGSMPVVRVPIRVGVRAPSLLDWQTSALLVGAVLAVLGFFMYRQRRMS
jgi:hypothetical protein